MIFDELKDISTIPELQIKYRSISDAENDVDVKYREYLCTQKFEKKKDYCCPLKILAIINNWAEFLARNSAL